MRTAAGLWGIAIFVLVCVFEKKIRTFLWKGKGKTIGVSDDETAEASDPSLWDFSFYTYDPEDDVRTAENDALGKSSDENEGLPESQSESSISTSESNADNASSEE